MSDQTEAESAAHRVYSEAVSKAADIHGDSSEAVLDIALQHPTVRNDPAVAQRVRDIHADVIARLAAS